MGQPCPRCGGDLDRAIGATFARCPFCSAAVVRTGDAVLEHYVVAKRLAPEAARRALDRWMVGNEPSRWLAGGAKLEAPELVWLPVWYARTGADAMHVIAHEARADATTAPEVKRRLVPPAGMRRLDGKTDPAEALPEPTLPWADFVERELEGETVVESALVHVPFYRFLYRYRGRRYSAAIDAATGEVRPGRFPRRPDLPFAMLSIAAFAMFAIADLSYAHAIYEGDAPPRVIPLIYPFAWLAVIALARLLTAVF